MSEYINMYVDRCRSCEAYLGPSSYELGECYECYLPFSRVQRKFAQENPEIYEKKVVLPGGQVKTVIEQAEFMDFENKIHEVFGLFAITDRGIECLSHEYPIDKKLFTDSRFLSEMKIKTWVNVDDFNAALSFAKARWGIS